MNIQLNINIDDRYVNSVKRLVRSRRAKIRLLTLLLGIPLALHAAPGSITKPNTFATGGVISAAQVNANFDTLYTKVNDNDTRITRLESGFVSVSGEGFQPGGPIANQAYFYNYGGMGGAYFFPISPATSYSGAMVAAVTIPHGATVDEFTVFANGNASFLVGLGYHPVSGSYYPMATVNTNTTGYHSVTTTTITTPIIDNSSRVYYIYAYSSVWTSSMVLMGAIVRYHFP
jgi:hypothetical protein